MYFFPISRTYLYVYIPSNAQNFSKSHPNFSGWLASIKTDETVNVMLKKDRSCWWEGPTGGNFG